MRNVVKKSLAMLLILVLLIPLFCTEAFAEEKTSGADYTTVFIHGLMGFGDEDELSDVLPYWGLLAGDMPDYLESLGYETYVASVGPISSAHDRCCEVFAQLTGTRVDYGQAHADKCTAEFASKGYCLTHSRYGRDYTGNAQVESWGPIYDENDKPTGEWYDNKINLVGHSFGGPTSCQLLQYLAEGDPDEIAFGKEQAALYGGNWHDYVSPLFWGSEPYEEGGAERHGEYLIHSVTSLAGVLNGTTFISSNKNTMVLAKDLSALIANALGTSEIADLYDFQLEQFGLTQSSNTGDLEAYFSLLDQKGFIAGSDHAFYDLSIEGTNKLKQGWNTYDNVYYFSFAGDKCFSTVCGSVMPDADMWALLLAYSANMSNYTNKNERVLDVNGNDVTGIDREWLNNDGMVNTISARYPLGANHTAYNINSIKPGTWNYHVDQDLDHMEFIGGLYIVKPYTTRNFYRDLMADISRTTPIMDETTEPGDSAQSNRLSAPTIWYAGRSALLGKPSLNWTASIGASCYAVYRATSENGDYKKIATTVATLYTDTSAKARTTYYYKVVAVPLSSRKVCSDFSAPVCVRK